MAATGDDRAQGVAVDSLGNAYVAGLTYSDDFPTQGPIQAARNGNWDAFVTKLEDTDTNHPPVLATIGDRAVTPGEQLTLTAVAVDPDLPADTLSFSLDSAPAGTTIDHVTGELNWTATVAGDAETITVRGHRQRHAGVERHGDVRRLRHGPAVGH